jgi:hypothetical protein
MDRRVSGSRHSKKSNEALRSVDAQPGLMSRRRWKPLTLPFLARRNIPFTKHGPLVQAACLSGESICMVDRHVDERDFAFGNRKDGWLLKRKSQQPLLVQRPRCQGRSLSGLTADCVTWIIRIEISPTIFPSVPCSPQQPSPSNPRDKLRTKGPQEFKLKRCWGPRLSLA